MSETVLTRGWMPLTLPQLDFWEEFALHPDQPISTVAHYLDIDGVVDGAALYEAIAKTVREAEILSVRFRIPSGEQNPLQYCDPQQAPEVLQFDLRDRSDPLEAAQELMQADVHAKLDLLNDPVSAQWLLRISETRYLWYIRAHHIILDGFGLLLIEQRCAQLYAHFLGHIDAGHAFYPFASFLAEEEAYCAGQRYIDDKLFWTEYLKTSTKLPIVHKGAEAYRAPGMYFQCALPDELCRNLQRMTAETRIGWPDLLVMLSAAYFFYHFPTMELASKQPLTLWLPFMSRWGSVSAHIPAMLANILPLRLSIEREETLAAFLKRLAGILRKQRSHGRYRVEQIAADQGTPKGSRYLFSPLVNVVPFNPPIFEGCNVRRNVLANGPGDGFEITFRGREDGSGLTLHIEVDPALVSRDAFERHQQNLPAFIKRALTPSALAAPVEDLCIDLPAFLTA